MVVVEITAEGQLRIDPIQMDILSWETLTRFYRDTNCTSCTVHSIGINYLKISRSRFYYNSLKTLKTETKYLYKDGIVKLWF